MEGLNLTAYPNPTSAKTNIEFNMVEAGAYSLEIYDKKGALVKMLAKGTAESSKLVYQELDGASFEEGVYLVKLTTGQQLITTRVLVAR